MRAVWISGLTAAVTMIAIGLWLAPLKPGFLQLQFAFTPRAFGDIVHAWPDAHLARYRLHLAWDLVLIASYARFGWLLATRTATFAGLPVAWQRLARAWLPLAAAFDLVENGLHAWLTAAPRFDVPAAYAASGTVATLKWALLIGFGVLVAGALWRAGDPAAGNGTDL